MMGMTLGQAEERRKRIPLLVYSCSAAAWTAGVAALRCSVAYSVAAWTAGVAALPCSVAAAWAASRPISVAAVV